MIYVTEDLHGEYKRFDYLMRAGKEVLTKADTLMVGGDFGFIFRNDAREKYFLDLMEEKPYTIAFCDGNHENFPALFSYPEEIWNGGKVHRIRKNIYHLMRGQVFTIEEKRFFVMGGAYSIDKAYRQENVSWWAQELPSPQEYREAIANLVKYNYEVDYIVSHTAPSEIIRRMGYEPNGDDVKRAGFLEWVRNEVDYIVSRTASSKIIRQRGYEPSSDDADLTNFLDWVMEKVSYQKWFFGHWHKDLVIDEKHRALWFDIERI